MRPALITEVREVTGVGAARRRAAELGQNQGFGEARLSDLAIVVTELATNLVKHTPGGGTLLLSSHSPGSIDVLSIDSGPGIARPGEVLRDGYSTTGTAGTGLGAVSRLADSFDLHAWPGKGSVVFAQLCAGAGCGPAAFDIGAVQRALPGETVCGDDWAYTASLDQMRLAVIDGLGHGLSAHEASRAAVTAFAASSHLRPEEALRTLHAALRGTRGAVGAVATIDTVAGHVQFAGAGNISGTVLDSLPAEAARSARRGLVSHNGTLGQEVRKFQEQQVPWSAGSVLALHTDGLSASLDVSAVPGLLRRRAAVIAGVLYRESARSRDDATVVVVKGRA